MVAGGAELDFNFAAGDAEASCTFPMKAGEVKKGGHAMLRGHPCKILEVNVSKTGKHGHAKAHMVGLDVFTGKRYEDMFPTSHTIEIPVVVRSEYQLVSLGCKGSVSLLLGSGELKSDLNVPTLVFSGEPSEEDERVHKGMEEAYNKGEEDIFVVVVAACGHEKIVGFRLVKPN